jgi:hypothetical protein
MKKILILLCVLSLNLQAQKVVNNKQITNTVINVDYVDEAGNGYRYVLPINTFSNSDSTKYAAFNSVIQSRLDTIPKVVIQLTQIQFTNPTTTDNYGVFTLSSSSRPALQEPIDSLNADDLKVGDSVLTALRGVLGKQVTSINAIIGAGTFTANGVEFNYNTVNNGSGGLLGRMIAILTKEYNSFY